MDHHPSVGEQTMGLTPTICRTLIRFHKNAGLKGPLLTLGNQDVWATHDQLKCFFQEMDCEYQQATAFPHSSKLFAQTPETASFVHARTFFQMLGITEYNDLDKFEDDAPSLLHDLNSPVGPDL